MNLNAMNTEQIQKLIPHRKPMLLVDEVVSQTEKSIHCKKTFGPDEFFLQRQLANRCVISTRCPFAFLRFRIPVCLGHHSAVGMT